MDAAEIQRTARAASKNALFGYKLLDFVDRLGRARENEDFEGVAIGNLLRRVEGQPDKSRIGIGDNVWAELWPSEMPEDQRAIDRAWERWKDRMVEFGLGTKQGRASNIPFEIDLYKMRVWAEVAIASGIKLAEAYREATGRSLEVLEVPRIELDRTLTTDDLVRELGIEIHSLYRWIKKGLPHTRAPGTKGFGTLLFNLNEVRAWLATQIDTSRRTASHYEERLPLAEASLRLRAVRDTLGLSNDQLADKLGVATGTLQRWIVGAPTLSTVPLKAVIDAEELLGERGIDVVDAKPGPRVVRMPQAQAAERLLAVRSKLNMSTTVMAELLGVPPVTLKSWLGTGGKVASTVPAWVVEGAEKLTETMEPRVYRSVSSKLADPGKVRKAFLDAGGSVAEAARLLHVVQSAAATAAKRLGIKTKERVVLADVISAEELQAALERHGGNATQAGRELGIDRLSAIRLAGVYGLGGLIIKRGAS